MADATITAANIGYGTGALTQKNKIAGEALTHGQAVYLESDGEYNKASTLTAATALVAGYVLNAAASGQTFTLLTKGDLYGLTLTSGKSYEISSTAGNTADAGDAGSAEFACGLGVAKSTTVLNVNITVGGVVA